MTQLQPTRELTVIHVMTCLRGRRNCWYEESECIVL